MTEGVTTILPIPGAGLSYGFNDKGEVAKIVKNADGFGTAPADAFSIFTGSWLQKNKADYDTGGRSGPDNWNNLSRDLLADKVTDSGRIPSDGDLKSWGTSKAQPLYIPEISLTVNQEYMLSGVHAPDQTLAEVGSDVRQKEQNYSTKARTWTLRDAGGGTLRLESKWSPGKCLDLVSDKAVVGACTQGISTWHVTSAYNGFKLRNPDTNKVLDLPAKNGDQAVGWGWHGGANQRIQFTKPSQAHLGKTYTMDDQQWHNNADANLGDRTVNPYDRHGKLNQQWTVVPTGRTTDSNGQTGAEVSLLRNGATGECLTKNNDSYQRAVVRACDASDPAQGWVMLRVQDNDLMVRITNVAANRSLEAQGKGGTIVTNPPYSMDRQYWWLNPVKGAAPMGEQRNAGDTAAPPTTTVNTFGSDYRAKPGEVLGKDGKEGLKTRVLRDGKPATGVEVEFTVPKDRGLYFDQESKHVHKVSVSTGADGTAAAPPLHAGDKEGEFKVTMTAMNEPGATNGEHPTGTYTVHVKK